MARAPVPLRVERRGRLLLPVVVPSRQTDRMNAVRIVGVRPAVGHIQRHPYRSAFRVFILLYALWLYAYWLLARLLVASVRTVYTVLTKPTVPTQLPMPPMDSKSTVSRRTVLTVGSSARPTRSSSRRSTKATMQPLPPSCSVCGEKATRTIQLPMGLVVAACSAHLRSL